MSKSTITPFSASISTPAPGSGTASGGLPSGPDPSAKPYVSPFAAPVVREIEDSDQYEVTDVPDSATKSPLTGRDEEKSGQCTVDSGQSAESEIRPFSERIKDVVQEIENFEARYKFSDKGWKPPKRLATDQELHDWFVNKVLKTAKVTGKEADKLRERAADHFEKYLMTPKEEVPEFKFGEDLKPFSEKIVPKEIAGRNMGDWVFDYLGMHGWDDVPEDMTPAGYKRWLKGLRQAQTEAVKIWRVHSGYETIIDNLKKGLKVSHDDAKDLICKGYTPSDRKKLAENEKSQLKKAGFNPWIKLWMKGVKPFSEVGLKPFSEGIEKEEWQEEVPFPRRTPAFIKASRRAVVKDLLRQNLQGLEVMRILLTEPDSDWTRSEINEFLKDLGEKPVAYPRPHKKYPEPYPGIGDAETEETEGVDRRFSEEMEKKWGGENSKKKRNEYQVKMRIPEKERHLNPKTNRLKNFRHIRYLTTKIPIEERTLKNLPRYANGKTRVRFQDWLELDRPQVSPNAKVHSVGRSPNSKWYGWSHRAIHGFKVGDIIKPGTIGNRYQHGKFKSDEEFEKAGKFRPYEIKTDKEAEEHAIRFARDVS